MTPETLDYLFPFLVLLYGMVMVFSLTNPLLVKIAEERLSSEILLRFRSHLALGWICLVVGFVWSVQNLLFFN